MQRVRPTALAERATPGTILAAGVTAALAALAFTVPATGAADLVLAGAGGAFALATGWAWRVAVRARSLPLELSPVAGTGVVDGVVAYRFRARLGHGRAFRDPVASVTWEPADGAPVTLPAGPLPASACGPLTLVARDPDGRVGASGAFRVQLHVRSAGRTWSAAAVVPRSSVVAGRFAGVRIVSGRLTFDEAWDALRPDEAPLEQLTPS